MVFVALIAVFAISAVAASSASATPEWYVKKGGKFAKVTEPVKVHWYGSIEVVDTKYNGVFGKQLAVSCTIPEKENETGGTINVGGAALIKIFIGENCKRGKHNEVCVGEPERFTAVELPWATELYKEGSEVRSRIVPGYLEGKEPGVFFECSQVPDVCEILTSTNVTNNTVAGLVEVAFEAKSNKTTCREGGKESGEWLGVLKIAPTSAEKTKGVEAIKVE